MSRLRSIFILSTVICTLLAPLASSQGGFPFTIEVRQEGTVGNLPPGGTILLEAPAVRKQVSATVSLTFNGRQTANGLVGTTIQAIALTGATDFSVNAPTPPFGLAPGESFTLTTRYAPGVSDLQEGVLQITYAGENADLSFDINLNGTAPEFAFSYTPAGGNATQIRPGVPVDFPDTNLDATAAATFTVTNVGTAPGTIDKVRAREAAYTVTGLPLLPAEVGPNAALTFTLSFTPEALGLEEGALFIDTAGVTLVFPLQGTGVGALFTYEVIKDGQASPVQPNGEIRLGDTPVGETAEVTLQVRNSGNTEGTISTISTQGDAYALADLPFLPSTIQADGTMLFTVRFAPVEIGQLAGRLLIGDDEFDLLGAGVGSFLEFTTNSRAGTTPIEDGGTVVFSPTAAGGAASLTFTIKNSGTAETTINSISLGSTGSAFALSGVPGLPLTLASNATASFSIEFAPAVEGNASETLLIDTASFSLTGTATPPAPLPGYVWDGPSGTVEPRTQPSIGLTLAEAYSSRVTGTLSLRFASDGFSDDPSVQFATGGRVVDFEIPQGETEAIFPNGTNGIRLQTGTVAGSITITPEFATAGGADLTPETPDILAMTVVAAAPEITGIVISNKSLNALVLEISGFATPRSVTTIDLTFSPRPGESVSTTNVTIDAAAAFAAWYQSSRSASFGSQFTVTVPLNFAGAVNQTVGLANTIQDITATLANELGTSGPATVTNPEGF